MVNTIPDGYILKYHIVGCLKDIVDSSKYRAPEMQMLTFREVERIFAACVFRMYNSVSKEELPEWVSEIINTMYEFHDAMTGKIKFVAK